MANIILSLAFIAVIFVSLVHSRTCKHIGGSCDSDEDCLSGSCPNGQCEEKNSDERNYKSRASHQLRLGDMKFKSSIEARSGIVGEQYRWPDANLTYELDPSFTSDELALIRKCLNAIASVTCVTFVERTTEADWVYFLRGVGVPCDSYVGKIGGRQTLDLGVAENEEDPTCMWESVIVHETLHALGFNHEMNRFDRDDYVSINWENIACSEQFNFYKDNLTTAETFGVPYDFQSIMHYGTNEGGIDDSLPVIIPKVEGVKVGGTRLSPADILRINRMYKCTPP